jgi:hypothetical protein
VIVGISDQQTYAHLPHLGRSLRYSCHGSFLTKFFFDFRLFRHEETNVATFESFGCLGSFPKSSCIAFLFAASLGRRRLLVFAKMIVAYSDLIGVLILNKLAERQLCEILVRETDPIMVKQEEVLRKPFAKTFSSVPLTPEFLSPRGIIDK